MYQICSEAYLQLKYSIFLLERVVRSDFSKQDGSAPAKRQRKAQGKPKKRKAKAKAKKPKKRQRKGRWVITAYFDVMAHILIPDHDAPWTPLIIRQTYDDMIRTGRNTEKHIRFHKTPRKSTN